MRLYIERGYSSYIEENGLDQENFEAAFVIKLSL